MFFPCCVVLILSLSLFRSECLGLRQLIQIYSQDTLAIALLLLQKVEHILWQLTFLRMYMKVSTIALHQTQQLL